MTKLLVGFSLIGSCISLMMSMSGKGELYPFFYWKLYTQPIGWDHQTTVTRIYATNDPDTTYSRIPLKSYPDFSKDEVCYSVDYAVSLMKDDRIKANRMLIALCRHLEPQYHFFRIVNEEYDPETVLKGNNNHHDTIITEIHF
jgi:hypothetical protein